ncbi:carboxypeptidase-like regulatory domain-containing protein [Pontibacter sp. 172403-2]|uniref:carboxypeptidase-like regulatory domain-containing protein n=1 Tax=Pontibacter rufus TaxID=2791028 RepID=UPI0018AF5D55|nr:carboxypeptidase-like regulatory domain-containing protein [Pontibacter sp. 172403-2]MBF9252973.1 carboxypeptidase-like regulatory domain-containing protein [Pontibacter sp. 172403-2]
MHKAVIAKLTFVLFLLFTVTLAHAQTPTIQGVVRSESKEAIPFVNIGIKKKGVGAAADANGNFTLKLGNEFLDDTLTFSAIGYQELSMPVKAIVMDKTREFILEEKSTALREVLVLSKKPEIRKLGVKYKLPFIMGTAQTRNNNDISELAQLINIDGKSAELLSASVYLKSTKADSATFRINFYKNAGGQPGQRLVEKSIIKRLPLSNGWVAVDLQPYGIFVADDFFIGFEYLPDSRNTEKFLFFYGAVLGGSIYARNVSLGEWRTTAGGRLSAYVTVRQ